jgi:hypothetical protein
MHLTLHAQRVQINNTDTTINSEFHSSSQILLLQYSHLHHLQHSPRHHRSYQPTSSNRSHPARSPRTRRRRRAATWRRTCRATLYICNRDARHARAVFALVVCEELGVCFELDVCALSSTVNFECWDGGDGYQGLTYVVQSTSMFTQLNDLHTCVHAIEPLVVHTRVSRSFQARIEMMPTSLL